MIKKKVQKSSFCSVVCVEICGGFLLYFLFVLFLKKCHFHNLCNLIWRGWDKENFGKTFCVCFRRFWIGLWRMKLCEHMIWFWGIFGFPISGTIVTCFTKCFKFTSIIEKQFHVFCEKSTKNIFNDLIYLKGFLMCENHRRNLKNVTSFMAVASPKSVLCRTGRERFSNNKSTRNARSIS